MLNIESTLSQEVLGGMLDLEPRRWRKPIRENFDDQRKKVLQFSQWWKPYDCTKTDTWWERCFIPGSWNPVTDRLMWMFQNTFMIFIIMSVWELFSKSYRFTLWIDTNCYVHSFTLLFPSKRTPNDQTFRWDSFSTLSLWLTWSKHDGTCCSCTKTSGAVL